MPGQKQLCYIEDVFTVIGRGIVVVPTGLKSTMKAQDWIEIRSGDGSRYVARVRSLVKAANNKQGFLLSSVTREEVQSGDEIWSVVEPPAKEPPDIFFRAAKPTRQLPEVLTPDFWRRLVARR